MFVAYAAFFLALATLIRAESVAARARADRRLAESRHDSLKARLDVAEKILGHHTSLHRLHQGQFDVVRDILDAFREAAR